MRRKHATTAMRSVTVDALVLVLILHAFVVSAKINIEVVVSTPSQAQVLASGIDAALQRIRKERPQIKVEVSVEPEEPIALAPAICRQAKKGATAVVGGGNELETALSAASAARAGVPLLLVSPPGPANASWEALALYPHPDILAQACAALCNSKGWTSAVLLHEGSPTGAALIAPEDEPLMLLARRLPPASDEALLRNLLLILKKSGAVNFIVWCDVECTFRVLEAALRVGLLAEKHSYILLTLDLHTQALENYSYGGANVTGFRLFDPDSEDVKYAMENWRAAYIKRLGGNVDRDEAAAIAEAPPTALLLTYDAAVITEQAMKTLKLQEGLVAKTCNKDISAFHAETLLNYLRSEDWTGLTGILSWGANGTRRKVKLGIIELQRHGSLQTEGHWDSEYGIVWERHPTPVKPKPKDDMTNRTFTILIAENKPYVMKQESEDRLSGNERYEGYCIELIQRLAKLLHFNYTFVEQTDKNYGTFDNVTQRWTGIMGRLMYDEDIDFAITDLTITSEREKLVDFTTPFMNLGIGILFRTPKPPEPEIFAFLLPFSNGVWICLGVAYIGTSLLLFVVGRLCPEEWQNPYPCIEEPVALENQFTLANALWFNLGAVLLQGSEIAPVAYSTRAVASVWWLFALVITSSYTANLATLLAKKTSTDIITSAESLAYNTENIKYGAKAGGSTYTFFEHSQSKLFQDMYKEMAGAEMPADNEAGINKVMKENYAFLMESTTIEYTIERNCEVTKVGELLDSKGYGIAMKKNSLFRQALNLALLNLQEAGILREMKQNWWKEKHGGGACKEQESRESEELTMRSFFGLFLVLVVGCAIGVVGSCCDLLWVVARHPRDPSRPLSRRFWSELRFVFQFSRSVKPVEGALTEPRTASPSAPTWTPRTLSEEPEPDEGEGRRPSGRGSASRRSSSANRWARRSSIHAASMRLARHRQSPSPPPVLRKRTS